MRARRTLLAADFVTLEIDDERVDGYPDRDDDARYASQCQSETDGLAQDDYQGIDQDPCEKET